MYIDDCLKGTQMIMASDIEDPINLGSDESVTINQLVDIVEDIAGITLKRTYDLSAPKGVNGRNSDNTLITAASRLGAQCQTCATAGEDLPLDLRPDDRGLAAHGQGPDSHCVAICRSMALVSLQRTPARRGTPAVVRIPLGHTSRLRRKCQDRAATSTGEGSLRPPSPFGSSAFAQKYKEEQAPCLAIVIAAVDGPVMVLLAAALLELSGGIASAQDGDPRSTARLRLGPVYVAPTFEVRDIGVDTNVYNESLVEPIKDFVLTAIPTFVATVGPPRRALTVRSATSLVYFAKQASERSVNEDLTLTARGTFGRFVPFAELGYSEHARTCLVRSRCARPPC